MIYEELALGVQIVVGQTYCCITIKTNTFKVKRGSKAKTIKNVYIRREQSLKYK